MLICNEENILFIQGYKILSIDEKDSQISVFKST